MKHINKFFLSMKLLKKLMLSIKHIKRFLITYGFLLLIGSLLENFLLFLKDFKVYVCDIIYFLATSSKRSFRFFLMSRNLKNLLHGAWLHATYVVCSILSKKWIRPFNQHWWPRLPSIEWTIQNYCSLLGPSKHSSNNTSWPVLQVLRFYIVIKY